MSESLLPPVRRPDPRRTDISRYPYTLEIATRWGDQDPLQHLNNVAISGLYEEARSAFMRELRQRAGVSMRGLVGAVYVDYLQEGHYPAPVLAGVGVAEVGRSSLRLCQVLVQGDVCIGVAEAVMVSVGQDRRAAPVPEAWRPVLEAARVTATPA